MPHMKLHFTDYQRALVIRAMTSCLAFLLSSSSLLAWDASAFKKPSQEELKRKLTAEQFKVTQEEGTEAPFRNAYADEHGAGIYVDIVSGEPLFSSLDKFDSGTGWPSFTRPLSPDFVVKKVDRGLFMKRTEVRSKIADSHLGHVFDDGPQPTGLRYCMNSAALRFVPANKLEAEGYGEWVKLFSGAKEEAKGSELLGKETAIFAGGCFWCMEAPFDRLKGVLAVKVGYTGGQKEKPTYEQVSAGGTGHAEAVEITYNPKDISYEKLLDVFWHQIDPTTPDAQFCDHGSQYRSAVFYTSEAQKIAAEASKAALEKTGPFKAKIVTEITAASPFYEAEDYHQHYYQKNPVRYKYYRFSCGRDQYLDKIWGATREKD